MSVANYEGPASSKEVGDQRFLETVGLHASAVEIPVIIETQQTMVSQEQTQSIGNLMLRPFESV